MATPSPETMAAVRRKLNVTWDDFETDERLADVVGIVSPRLASRLGLPSSHEFTPADEHGAWGLFLNACLYEFSDAWDDFTANYRTEIDSVRLLTLAGGGEDAEAQG